MNVLTTRFLLTLLSIFLSIIFQLNAQNSDYSTCGFTGSNSSIELTNSIKPQLEKYEQEFIHRKSAKGTSRKIISIPIKAHIIRHDDSSGGLSVSDLNAALVNLNNIYADASMEFFVCDGINYIDSDLLSNFKKGNEILLAEINNVPGMLNIYFVDEIENLDNISICGYTYNEGRTDVIAIKSSCAKNKSSLAHEIGHFFSLIHTHGPSDKKTTELVDGSNCDTDGDGICDTPADPVLSENNTDRFCSYIGSETDANGDKYIPDTHNIMSYSRKDCRVSFTPQQLARMYAFYQVAKNYLSCPSFNADFTADVSQTCDELLTVNFESYSDNVTKWEWDMNSDGITDYTTKNPSHTFNNGIYNITLKVSNKTKSISKTLSNFIKVGTETDFFDENFESNTLLIEHSGWTVKDLSGRGYNWLLNKGQTITVNTGPSLSNSQINTSNTYIYAEASGAKYGDITELISPCINVEYQNSELEFAYHMFGEGIGELHVDIETDYGYVEDVIEPLYGSQQENQEDDFLTKTINLSNYANQTINIHFRAVRGSNWEGDIALDNIFIKTITSSITDEPIKIYPNPVKGDVIHIKAFGVKELLTTYDISNLEGQIFISGTLSKTNQSINVGNLSSGMYFLTVRNKQTTNTKKIIK